MRFNDIEDFKNISQLELEHALQRVGMDGVFKVQFNELLSDPKYMDEYSGTFKIDFKYGNCEHSHIIQLNTQDLNSIGICCGEDDEILPIIYGELIGCFYFDLALDSLEDKYLQ